MGMISTNQFKGGVKIILDGDPYNIVENEMVKPGKGQAFNRVRVRNLKNGRTVEKTFKSGEQVEEADVFVTELQYLYNDGEQWHFMDEKTFEQHAADEEAMSESKLWIKEQDKCEVIFWNGSLLQVDAPKQTTLTVTETDPGLKGDTASGGVKPATLETGAVIRVPLFMSEGDVVRVDTRTGEYLGRA